MTKTTKQTGYEELNDGKVEWRPKSLITETAMMSRKIPFSETEEDGTKIMMYTYDTIQ